MTPIDGRFVMHFSFSDFPQVWGRTPRTWGPEGLRTLLDSVAATGIRVINFRITRNLGFSNPLGWDPGHVDYANWEVLEAGVEYAHSHGMQIWGWYDQTDSHGGCGYGGKRKHTAFILNHPHTIRCPLPGCKPNPIEVSEHLDPNCPLRGKGSQGSLAFREVQDFRLKVIGEVVKRMVDGMYIVEYGTIGYEEPVTRGFRESLGMPPTSEIDPSDPRWISHQSGFLVSYLRRVRGVTAGGPIACRLTVEFRGPTKQTSGLRPWALEAIPELLEKNIIDGAAVWVAPDVYKLRDRLGIPARQIHRRYEIPPMDPATMELTIREMLDAGVGTVDLDEATNVEMKPGGWALIKSLVQKHARQNTG